MQLIIRFLPVLFKKVLNPLHVGHLRILHNAFMIELPIAVFLTLPCIRRLCFSFLLTEQDS